MNRLAGCVDSPTGAATGFDTDTKLCADTARQFKQAGFDFCVRYLSRGAESPGADLTYEEASGILGAGLALMPVQHVSAAGWLPDAGSGQVHGSAAAANAQDVGFPPGVNLWCDLEGCSSDAGASAVIAYCKAWYAAVAGAGYVPGLYVGANAVLTGQQLYTNLPFQHYWQSESRVPEVAERGYQMVQTVVTEPVMQIGIDKNVTKADRLGGQVLWLAPVADGQAPQPPVRHGQVG